MNYERCILSMVAALVAATTALGQWSFTVDTTFRVPLVAQNVNDLLLNEDGTLIASGRMTVEGQWPPTVQYPILRFDSDGLIDNMFQIQAGGGKLTTWQDRFFVSTGAYPLRVLSDGYIDPSFISLNLGPYFYALQGGDYHVFPDGRVLISGNHLLSDSVRGFEGLYQLVWFTNTGYLDTTRIHRSSGNCAVYQFKELPTGQFIVNGICDQFDGQPVDRVFRVQADGSVDTSFHTDVYTGLTADYLPLNDGRVYVAGNFRRSQTPEDTLHLVRFSPTGALDPTFVPPQFQMATLPEVLGAAVISVQPWLDGSLLVTGKFERVNGEPRRGICLLDTNGTLLPAFHDQGVSPYYYTDAGEDLYRAAVHAVAYDSTNAHLYIAGAYSGYTDATGHYPDQRFITRLKVSELSTAVSEAPQQPRALQLYPNPSTGPITVAIEQPPDHGDLLLRDALGRVVNRQRITAYHTSLTLDHTGVYSVELVRDGRTVETQRLIVHP
ncbi:MAG: T9SS type A sorting domain-containing protein [Flavobacteriales bacterium]|nr:T9SS type A sorting domain-containing protein [Flavobacteriales bacterium]